MSTWVKALISLIKDILKWKLYVRALNGFYNFFNCKFPGARTKVLNPNPMFGIHCEFLLSVASWLGTEFVCVSVCMRVHVRTPVCLPGLHVCMLVYLPYAEGSSEQRHHYPFIRPAASVSAGFPDLQSKLHLTHWLYSFSKPLLT